MENKKIVFFDIDGTLLPHDTKDIPENTANAVKQLINNGVEVVIATGRTYQEAKRYIDFFDIKSYIVSDGQHVVINGVEEYLAYFTPAHKNQVIKYLDDQKMAFVLQTPTKLEIPDNEDGQKIVERLESHGFQNANMNNQLRDIDEVFSFYVLGESDVLENLLKDQDKIGDAKFLK